MMDNRKNNTRFFEATSMMIIVVFLIFIFFKFLYF